MTSPEPSERRAVEILLIEANHGDMRLMKELFADAGITNEIHVVYDGDEALDFIHQHGGYTDAPLPDIILLDLKLPGRKSEDVLDTLSNRSELASIPVIGMTGSGSEVDIAKSSGINVDSYIQKPLNPDEFLDAIQNMGGYGITIVRKSSRDTV